MREQRPSWLIECHSPDTEHEAVKVMHENHYVCYWVGRMSPGVVFPHLLAVPEDAKDQMCIRDRGPEVNLVLTYNSASPAGGIFGPGWSFSYEWLLEQKGEKVCVRKGSGQVFTFTAAAGGSAEQPAEARPPAGISHRLIACGDYWLYLEKGSPIYYRFDRVPGTSLGRLTAIVDYYGNIVKLDYSRQGNLKSIADGAGRVIRFTFNKRNLCTSFALPDGRRASFSYDGQGRLAHTEDLMGISVDYEYDSTQALTRMVTGRSKRTVAFSYRQAGNQKLLHSFTDANGNTTRYELLSNSCLLYTSRCV